MLKVCGIIGISKIGIFNFSGTDTVKLKRIDSKDFEMNKYTRNISKVYVFEVDLKYPKELRKLHNDYTLVPDKIEIKKEMLSNYHLKTADFFNIPIDNVKKGHSLE